MTSVFDWVYAITGFCTCHDLVRTSTGHCCVRCGNDVETEYEHMEKQAREWGTADLVDAIITSLEDSYDSDWLNVDMDAPDAITDTRAVVCIGNNQRFHVTVKRVA